VDIDSKRYGKNPHPWAQKPNLRRDEKEFNTTEEYMAMGLPIIGVCRGAQLLCIANGGELWQDSLEHHASHNLQTKDGIIPNAEAGHHQVMRLDKIPKEEYEIIAWCPFKSTVYDEDDTPHILEAAPEVVWFPKTKSLAIQPHPEWASYGTPFRTWIDNLVKEYTGQENIFDFYHSYL